MKILVTAGPTREAIDPVRFISNRSSGKMGYAVARAAARAGHEVSLVSGPVALRLPRGVTVVPVVTAAEMLAAVAARVRWCDALVMAAAVCDWRPARASRHKLKKRDGPPKLRLAATPDVLKALRARKGARVFVGFAAETRRVLAEARRKLADKGLDMIVANDVTRPGAGFETDTNAVAFVTADGVREFPTAGKYAVGRAIVRWIERRAAAKE